MCVLLSSPSSETNLGGLSRPLHSENAAVSEGGDRGGDRRDRVRAARGLDSAAGAGDESRGFGGGYGGFEEGMKLSAISYVLRRSLGVRSYVRRGLLSSGGDVNGRTMWSLGGVLGGKVAGDESLRDDQVGDVVCVVCTVCIVCVCVRFIFICFICTTVRRAILRIGMPE